MDLFTHNYHKENKIFITKQQQIKILKFFIKIYISFLKIKK